MKKYKFKFKDTNGDCFTKVFWAIDRYSATRKFEKQLKTEGFSKPVSFTLKWSRF